jgi:sulfate adenylyltransferase subunit 1 (EFTu-like GTPase family)
MTAQEPSIIQKLNNIKKNINHKTDVYIHIEKLYNRLPIYHIGVSFFNGYRTVRYDYRPFNENGSYITIDRKENDTFKNTIIHSKTIYWCQIDVPLNYIDKCEREIVDCYPKYRLGINDCRHYARRLTSKTTKKPTPVWKLYKIWNSV